MKSLIYLLIALASASCAVKNDNTDKELLKTKNSEIAATLNLQKYDGYWAQISSDPDNLIQISTSKDGSTGMDVTTAYGLNFQPDLPYLTSGFAKDDNLTIENHDGRNEALVIKTLAGKRRLITTTFDFSEADHIHLTIESNGTKYFRMFKKIDSSVETIKNFNRVQFDRAQQIIADQNANSWSERCDQGDSSMIEYIASYHMTKCINSWLAKKPNAEDMQILLKEMIKTANIAMIELFINAGADVNLAVPEGAIALRKAFSGYQQIAIQVGEHGFVQTNASPESVIELLQNHGLKD